MIDIVIASDIKIYSQGLGQILANHQDFDVVGIAATADQTLQLIQLHQPSIVLLDMTMELSCSLAQQVLQSSPHSRIVALAVSYDEAVIMHCAEIGITCYVPREASINQLLEGIRQAFDGECYCPPKIAACLLKKLQHIASHASESSPSLSSVTDDQLKDETEDLWTRLTRRECQIARLMSEGMSNKQIARDLSIEVSTVKNHVHNLLVKLEVQSRNQAVYLLQKNALTV